MCLSLWIPFGFDTGSGKGNISYVACGGPGFARENNRPERFNTSFKDTATKWKRMKVGELLVSSEEFFEYFVRMHRFQGVRELGSKVNTSSPTKRKHSTTQTISQPITHARFCAYRRRESCGGQLKL